ncbi:hypothetical protein AWZ03_002215 [Drosophila navojoa]|uniref:Uncharacterized protein n=1 Tax=Drosophila navojoa TaxID=7232 RepID=A0A484BTL1_DRONA|nr:uncharacterized protein LOC108649457 [Drosophila navojoa]TDG51420.1 hypothetical protein AWZ03_002215 [Drosophila navojoa]
MWVNGNASIAAEIYQLYALVLQFVDRRSIFYYNPGRLDCDWQRWQQWGNLSDRPQWVWHSRMPFAQLKEQQSSELFVLACLPASFDVPALAGLSASLNHLRDMPVLIELLHSSAIRQSDKDSLATQILAYCLKNSILNVVLYFQQDGSHLTLYSFSAFPSFTLIKRNLLHSRLAGGEGELFPDQLANLGGYTVRIMPVYSEPTSIIQLDANGEPRVSGYGWRLIETFAQKLGANISIVLPTWRPGRVLTEAYMLEFTRNGSIDFGLLSTQMSHRLKSRYYQYSYPIFYGAWCIILPIERHIDLRAVFARVLEAKALALLLISLGSYYLWLYLDRLLVPAWLRYCLRSLRITPWILALLVLCACQAQLVSLINMCPMEAPIDSFDALLASNIRIFGLREEFYDMDDEFRARYASAFRLTRNHTEFFQLRNSFNTSWAYPITAIKWVVMKELQSYFQRPVFRYSELCLSQNYPYSILLADESIFRKRLMMFTMRSRSSGLINHWMRHSLIDMVQADRMKIKDYSTASQVQPLRLQDLWYVGLCLGGGLLLAATVFVAELLPFYVNVWLDSL